MIPKTFEMADGTKVSILVPTKGYCLACDGSDAPVVKEQMEDLYVCRCDCGHEIVVSGAALTSGAVGSCGECGWPE